MALLKAPYERHDATNVMTLWALKGYRKGQLAFDILYPDIQIRKLIFQGRIRNGD
jgi:hypothetical protein